MQLARSNYMRLKFMVAYYPVAGICTMATNMVLSRVYKAQVPAPRIY